MEFRIGNSCRFSIHPPDSYSYTKVIVATKGFVRMGPRKCVALADLATEQKDSSSRANFLSSAEVRPRSST